MKVSQTIHSYCREQVKTNSASEPLLIFKTAIDSYILFFECVQKEPFVIFIISYLSANDTLMMCERANTLARRAAPFLYPCVIEYSLIAAAIVYKIYQVIQWS